MTPPSAGGRCTIGLAWQQGPLAPGATGRFLVPGQLPDRMLFAEPLRRRMRVKFGGEWIADSEDIVLLHEPGRYAGELAGRVAFAWRGMDAFYEEDDRIVGHAADPYHRIDIRTTSRHLVVRHRDQVIADARRAAWSYLDAWPEVRAVAGFISFEPGEVTVTLAGRQLRLEPGQRVLAHGIDRNLSLGEAPPGGRR